MSHTIALQFEDGVTRFIDCAENETIASAAYRQKVNIPLDCRDGACGTCKSFCESGRYDGGEYIEEALSEDEARAGYVLSCQMRPRADCVLRIQASSSACKTAVESDQGRLTALEWLSPSTLRFSIEPQRATPLAFLPGQYAHVQIPGSELSRAYSFSSPAGRHALSFLVRNVPDGRMSAYLREQAKVGDTLSFSAPYGSFYLRELRRPLLLLAGGTGLAPFLSMLETLAGQGCPQPVLLGYGVTHDADLVCLDELEALRARLPGFEYISCVADADSTHPRRGYVTQYLDAGVLNGGDVDLYVCGPPAMVDSVRTWLGELGIQPAGFHFEKFAPSH